jgi:octaprenyl-diphosphate synthase
VSVVSLKSRQTIESPSLDPLTTLVGEDLKLVNELILKEMQHEASLIPQLAGHLITAGGKRIRPLLTIATSRLCQYQGSRHINLAACVEFIHTATLLHDDVVDESTLRRGQPSANALWGNQASVLVGDFLFCRAFQLMVQDGDLEVLNILSSASVIIAEGEIKQLGTTQDIKLTQDKYISLIKAKTGALFEAACEIGAVIAQWPYDYQLALKTYGENLGIAFQLVDDVLDYCANQQELGKTVGDDFRDGKITLPVIYAYQGGSPEEKDFWERALGGLNQKESDLNQALAYLKKQNTLKKCITVAEDYGHKARQALEIFQPGPYKNALTHLIDFCTTRGY